MIRVQALVVRIGLPDRRIFSRYALIRFLLLRLCRMSPGWNFVVLIAIGHFLLLSCITGHSSIEHGFR